MAYNFFSLRAEGADAGDFQRKYRRPDIKHLQDPALRTPVGPSFECSTIKTDDEAALYDRFPGALHTHKVPESLQNDPRFQSLSADYFGRDYAKFKKIKVRGQTVNSGLTLGGRAASDKRKCRIVAMHMGQVLGVFGNLEAGGVMEYSVSFQSPTQMPEIDLHIRRPSAKMNDEAYNFKVFPERDCVSGQDLWKLAGEEEQYIGQDIVADGKYFQELQALLKDHKLAECKIRFKNAGLARWTGVDEQDVMDWTQQSMAGKTLPEQQFAVACLASCDEARIFFQNYEEQEPELRTFRAHFSAIWTLSMDYGMFWWYKAQLESTAYYDLDDENVDLNSFQPPPWLVTRVMVHTNKDGALFVEPLHWTSFERVMTYPTNELASFANRLATLRMQNNAKIELDKLIQRTDNNTVIQTEWHPLKGDDNWLVGVNVYDEENFTDIDVRPQRDSRLKLHYRGRAWPGKVCDNWYSKDAGTKDYTFTVAVYGKAHVDFVTDKDGVIWLPPRQADEYATPAHFLTIEWVEDRKSSNRLLQSVEEICRPIKRSSGVDAKRLFLHSPPSIKTTNVGVGKWPKDEFGEGNLENKLARLADEWRFDPSQQTALLEAFLAPSGCSLVHGPTGTGKSIVLSRILYLIRRIGTQGIACAPTNAAVERLLEAFLAALGDEYQEVDESGKPDWSIVLVTGDYASGELAKMFCERSQLIKADAHLSEDPPMAGNDAGAGQQRNPTPVNNNASDLHGVAEDDQPPSALKEEDLAMKAFFDMVRLGQSGVSPKMRIFILQYKFQLAVDWWRQDDNEALSVHKTAVEYVYWEHLASNEQDAGKQRRLLQKARKCEDTLWQEFWTGVRIVVCTSNAAATETLVKAAGFKPKMLISDEASLTTRTEALIPLAVFKESIVKTVFAGDHKQHDLVVIDEKDNEFVHLLSPSLFEQLAKQADAGLYTKTVLNVQHRTHPSLSAFSNAKIYAREQLEDAASTFKLVPEALTWQAFLKALGSNVYGHERGLRIGIDVNNARYGNDVWSRQYLNTTSMHNPCEAEALIRFVIASLDHEPPAGGAPIRGWHWMLVSPYWGQTQQLKKTLAKAAASAGEEWSKKVGLLDITITTTTNAQSQERDFVGVTFCRNKAHDPSDLNFISLRRQLKIELTRARYGLAMVGDFGHWIDAIAAGSTALQLKKYELMHQLIRDMHAQQDFVDYADIEAAILAAAGEAIMPGTSTFYRRHPTTIFETRQAGNRSASDGSDALPTLQRGRGNQRGRDRGGASK